MSRASQRFRPPRRPTMVEIVESAVMDTLHGDASGLDGQAVLDALEAAGYRADDRRRRIVRTLEYIRELLSGPLDSTTRLALTAVEKILIAPAAESPCPCPMCLGEPCHVCGLTITRADGGFCDEHKYDEQKKVANPSYQADPDPLSTDGNDPSQVTS